MRPFLFLFLTCAAASQTTPKPSEDARLNRLMQLAVKATPAACRAMGDSLTDESYDIRNRAGNALYWRCDRAAAAQFVPLLCRSIELGNAEAGTILLLGYAPPGQALPCLRQAATRNEMVKLTLGSRPVPIALPVQVAMARLADPDALHQLRRAFEKPDLPATLFLLGVLRDIEDPAALHAAIQFLADSRQAPGVVAHGTRQVHDVALEALVARYSLVPSFPIEPGRRYTPPQIAEIRSLLPAIR